MRVVVYEHITGGGFAGTALPAPLERDGEQMLQALLFDLSQTVGIELLTLRDARLPALPTVRALTVTTAADWQPAWQQALDWAEAVWPIAPESDGVLTHLSEDILAAGRCLLNSHPDAVRLTAAKHATYHHLHAAGIPTVATWPLLPLPLTGEHWREGTVFIVKPNDGAGCEDTYLAPNPATLARLRATLPNPDRFIVQPFISGDPLSLSLLCDDSQAELLSINRQHITQHDNQLHAHGVSVCALPITPPWQTLATALARAVPGLRGYVGVDLIATPAGPYVLEINPRLTTSYAGLVAQGIYPAQRVISLFMNNPYQIKA